MSKVVKSAGRSIGKIVKGAAKVLVPVYGLSQSKTGRKILKVAAVAAAVYFGGAALSGAMGSTAGGLTGALQGASQGIANAWTSLGTAASQAVGAATGASGASFGNALSSLGAGFGGNAATMAGTELAINGAVQGAAQAINPITQAAGRTFGVDPISGAMTVSEAALPAAKQAAPGLLSKMMSSPYTGAAIVQAGTGLIGGTMQAKGQQQMIDDERARYNRNVGTRLWG